MELLNVVVLMEHRPEHVVQVFTLDAGTGAVSLKAEHFRMCGML